MNNNKFAPKFKVINNTNYDSENTIPLIYRNNNKINTSLQNFKNNTLYLKTANKFYWKRINYPIYSYKKLNNILKIEINNIKLILDHIDNLQKNINNTQEQINRYGMKLNIFINNTFNISPAFNFLNNFIIIRNSSIEIHPMADLDTALVQNELQLLQYEEMDDLISLVPINNSLSATKQQINTCVELYNEYNNQNENLACLTEDYERATDIYNHLINTLKIELQQVPIINLTTNNKIEIFNEEIHDIVCIKDDERIDIYYMKKNYKNKFIQFISKIFNKKGNTN